ncbi:hypothetical protein DIPPA_10921 [Diplonema papillatum]|nr:hypothetical protein DIPPA_10921 [Diplonema papillatum]
MLSVPVDEPRASLPRLSLTTPFSPHSPLSPLAEKPENGADCFVLPGRGSVSRLSAAAVQMKRDNYLNTVLRREHTRNKMNRDALAKLRTEKAIIAEDLAEAQAKWKTMEHEGGREVDIAVKLAREEFDELTEGLKAELAASLERNEQLHEANADLSKSMQEILNRAYADAELWRLVALQTKAAVGKLKELRLWLLPGLNSSVREFLAEVLASVRDVFNHDYLRAGLHTIADETDPFHLTVPRRNRRRTTTTAQTPAQPATTVETEDSKSLRVGSPKRRRTVQPMPIASLAQPVPLGKPELTAAKKKLALAEGQAKALERQRVAEKEAGDAARDRVDGLERLYRAAKNTYFDQLASLRNAIVETRDNGAAMQKDLLSRCASKDQRIAVLQQKLAEHQLASPCNAAVETRDDGAAMQKDLLSRCASKDQRIAALQQELAEHQPACLRNAVVEPRDNGADVQGDLLPRCASKDPELAAEPGEVAAAPVAAQGSPRSRLLRTSFAAVNPADEPDKILHLLDDILGDGKAACRKPAGRQQPPPPDRADGVKRRDRAAVVVCRNDDNSDDGGAGGGDSPLGAAVGRILGSVRGAADGGKKAAGAPELLGPPLGLSAADKLTESLLAENWQAVLAAERAVFSDDALLVSTERRRLAYEGAAAAAAADPGGRDAAAPVGRGVPGRRAKSAALLSPLPGGPSAPPSPGGSRSSGSSPPASGGRVRRALAPQEARPSSAKRTAVDASAAKLAPVDTLGGKPAGTPPAAKPVSEDASSDALGFPASPPSSSGAGAASSTIAAAAAAAAAAPQQQQHQQPLRIEFDASKPRPRPSREVISIPCQQPAARRPPVAAAHAAVLSEGVGTGVDVPPAGAAPAKAEGDAAAQVPAHRGLLLSQSVVAACLAGPAGAPLPGPVRCGRNRDLGSVEDRFTARVLADAQLLLRKAEALAGSCRQTARRLPFAAPCSGQQACLASLAVRPSSAPCRTEASTTLSFSWSFSRLKPRRR